MLAFEMEDRAWLHDGHAPLRKWTDSELDALGRPTILLVEDDGDTRDMLVTLLELAGFDPLPCRTAEEALDHLREQEFDLVLTDYMLPGRSGAWLLSQASAEGLLESTPALVVTAHPNPTDLAGYEIVCKPFDLDALVERVTRRLESSGGGVSSKGGSGRSRPARKGGHDHRDDCRDPIELILYVSQQSPRSATAIDSIRDVLTRFKPSRVKLTICDLDGVPFTPGFVKSSQGPRTFILGHITNPELLLELLEGCEES